MNNKELKEYFLKHFDESEYIKIQNSKDNKLELIFSTPYDKPSINMLVMFNYDGTHNYSINVNVNICSIEDCDNFLFDLFEYDRCTSYNECMMHYEFLYNLKEDK